MSGAGDVVWSGDGHFYDWLRVLGMEILSSLTSFTDLLMRMGSGLCST